MKTEVLNLLDDKEYWNHIRRAAAVLEAGGLVAFPTETVYGLGASAAHPEALRRLREVKERTEGKPFTLHIGRRSDIHQYVPRLSGLARRLTEKGWPGPLTVVFHVPDVQAAPILDRLPNRDPSALYYNDTIGVRCPDLRACEDLLRETKVPVVAPSANRAGEDPPVRASEVLQGLDGRIELVLDGGTTRYAKPSTIVSVQDDHLDFLRAGVYDERTVRRWSTANYLFVCSGNTCRSPMAAGLFRKLLAERLGIREDQLEARGYNVMSAGTFAGGGSSVSGAAVSVLRKRGIDISTHRSVPLTIDMIQAADAIFAMSQSHVEAVVAMVPGAASKTYLLDPAGDIDDPIGGPDSMYEDVAGRIEAALRARLEEITV